MNPPVPETVLRSLEASAQKESFVAVGNGTLSDMIAELREFRRAKDGKLAAMDRVRAATAKLARFWDSHRTDDDLQDDAVFAEWKRLFAEYNEAQRTALELAGRIP